MSEDAYYFLPVHFEGDVIAVGCILIMTGVTDEKSIASEKHTFLLKLPYHYRGYYTSVHLISTSY